MSLYAKSTSYVGKSIAAKGTSKGCGTGTAWPKVARRPDCPKPQVEFPRSHGKSWLVELIQAETMSATEVSAEGPTANDAPRSPQNRLEAGLDGPALELVSEHA